LNTVKIRLFGEEKEALSLTHTDNIEAYQLYLKGLYSQNKLDYLNAVRYYEAALSIDPNYVAAYAKISMCYWDLAFFGLDPENNVYKCQSALEKAADLDDKNVEYLIAKGRMEFWYNWEFEKARITLEKALRINPNNPEGLKQMGALNMCLGRFSEGHLYLDKAEELDPFSLLGLTYIGYYYLWEKDWNKMMEYGNRIISMEPNLNMGYYLTGAAHLLAGKYEEAELNFEKSIRLHPDPLLFDLYYLGVAYAYNNEPVKARKVLNQMEGMRGEKDGGYSYIGSLYAALEDWDQAITNWEMAVKHHEGFMLFFHVSSFVSHPDMKENPRIEKLKERLGLPAPN
jgi:tetratricopeptide (TPR) repeat protein